MLDQNNTRLTLFLAAESKYPQLLTLYMIWFDGVVLMTPKSMTIVCRSYVIFISLLTLPMSVGCNVVRWVSLVLRFLTIYNTCMNESMNQTSVSRTAYLPLKIL